MSEIEQLCEVIKRLRAEDGCPWDREQTHSSLKAACIEEAAEVICGINIYEETGNPDNMCEELGDLLLQIVMNAEIASEEGLFTFEDVAKTVKEKMIRRHPHVFGNETAENSAAVLVRWNEIKKDEKSGKEWMDARLPDAFNEAEKLIDTARIRKGYK
ncbi:MAG: MazG nucleotide pyrophosphohydrolase domain-containing protein [Eubacteriales bacterium]|nr:MazG nucleotide pyrophosphohydrolase domain-containing protein [Eubacteriales bacterium]